MKGGRSMNKQKINQKTVVLSKQCATCGTAIPSDSKSEDCNICEKRKQLGIALNIKRRY